MLKLWKVTQDYHKIATILQLWSRKLCEGTKQKWFWHYGILAVKKGVLQFLYNSKKLWIISATLPESNNESYFESNFFLTVDSWSFDLRIWSTQRHAMVQHTKFLVLEWVNSLFKFTLASNEYIADSTKIWESIWRIILQTCKQQS